MKSTKLDYINIKIFKVKIYHYEPEKIIDRMKDYIHNTYISKGISM